MQCECEIITCVLMFGVNFACRVCRCIYVLWCVLRELAPDEEHAIFSSLNCMICVMLFFRF